MNFIRRILWTISLYREANNGANRAYWTAMPLGRITWGIAWLAAGSIVERQARTARVLTVEFEEAA